MGVHACSDHDCCEARRNDLCGAPRRDRPGELDGWLFGEEPYVEIDDVLARAWDTEEGWMTVAEWAEENHVSTDHAYYLTRKGKIEAVQPDGR